MRSLDVHIFISIWIHVSSVRVRWLFLCVQCLIHVCAMTHFWVCHYSIICVPSLIRMCNTWMSLNRPSAHVCDDSRMHVQISFIRAHATFYFCLSQVRSWGWWRGWGVCTYTCVCVCECVSTSTSACIYICISINLLIYTCFMRVHFHTSEIHIHSCVFS